MPVAAPSPNPHALDAIALIGFGEAAAAFLAGWRLEWPQLRVRAFDIKTNQADRAVRERKLADYASADVDGVADIGRALAGAQVVFSLVTADQAEAAARSAAAAIERGALYLDCNSCSPGAKRRSASVIERAGGRYVDVAVMAPVHPRLSKTPLLVSGPHAEAARASLALLAMNPEIAEGGVGAASSIKMIRSVMIKGLEALVVECTLSGRAAGVESQVIASLESSFPGFGWEKRAAYMLERVMTHGVRRAAEMREVAATIAELGVEPRMADAAEGWQLAIGELRLDALAAGETLATRAEAILEALVGSGEGKRKEASG